MEVSLRKFQLKPSEYLKNLPITLTVYGKPVAIVNTFQESVNTNQESVSTSVNTIITPQIPSVFFEEEPTKMSDPTMGFCEYHFEKGKTYARLLVSYEDENGNLIVEKKLLCPNCISKFKNRNVGKLIYH